MEQIASGLKERIFGEEVGLLSELQQLLIPIDVKRRAKSLESYKFSLPDKIDKLRLCVNNSQFELSALRQQKIPGTIIQLKIPGRNNFLLI